MVGDKASWVNFWRVLVANPICLNMRSKIRLSASINSQQPDFVLKLQLKSEKMMEETGKKTGRTSRE